MLLNIMSFFRMMFRILYSGLSGLPERFFGTGMTPWPARNDRFRHKSV